MRIVTGQQIADKGRKGFTLVELLIVLTIIIILVGLTAAVVVKALGLGAQATARHEIGQLANGISSFKQAFPNCTYIPSQFLLCEDGAYGSFPQNSPFFQLAQDSAAYLQAMFGKNFGVLTTAVDWNNDGVISPTNVNNPIILRGDQCLVFFLGGIPQGTSPQFILPQASNPRACLGFSTDPTLKTSTTTRFGPFYDFKPGRLVQLPDSSGNFNLFFSYQDAFTRTDPNTGYPVPYAYFSSYKSNNGYNRYATLLGGITDCPTLMNYPLYVAGNNNFTTPQSLAPYYQSTTAPGNPAVPTTGSTTYISPQGFQIISAGPDGLWGPGGFWPPATGYGSNRVVTIAGVPYSGSPTGGDDMSNFSTVQLGAPQK